MSVITEPEAAIAAAICLAARSLDDHGVTQRHPRRCGWCVWPLDELQRMVDGWNAWAGWDERRRVFARHDAEAFRHLPKDEQERRILDAQELEPEPMPAAAEPPADASPPADATSPVPLTAGGQPDARPSDVAPIPEPVTEPSQLEAPSWFAS